MRKHSPPETAERSDPLDAGESTRSKSLNVGWFESSHAGISSGHLHLFGESQNKPINASSGDAVGGHKQRVFLPTLCTTKSDEVAHRQATGLTDRKDDHPPFPPLLRQHSSPAPIGNQREA